MNTDYRRLEKCTIVKKKRPTRYFHKKKWTSSTNFVRRRTETTLDSSDPWSTCQIITQLRCKSNLVSTTLRHNMLINTYVLIQFFFFFVLLLFFFLSTYLTSKEYACLGSRLYLLFYRKVDFFWESNHFHFRFLSLHWTNSKIFPIGNNLWVKKSLDYIHM